MVPKTWRWSATSPSIWSAKSSTSDQSSAAASVPPGTRNTYWTLSAHCSQSRVNLDSLPCGFSAPPMTFEVGGKQYIAIASGPSASAKAKLVNTPELKDRRQATVLYVFGL